MESSSKPPLVSVVIPCFNSERWVREAIDSSLTQTHQPIEVIVIDDGSTDKSWEVIQSYGDQIISRTGLNRGGNAARNLGLGLASGRFIQFLDADDFLLPDKIRRQIEMLVVSKHDAVYEDWQRLQEYEDRPPKLLPVEHSGAHSDLLATLIGIWAPPPCAWLYQRDALLRCGGWDETLQCAQDWELLIRLSLSGMSAGYLPGVYSRYRRPAVKTTSTRNVKLMADTRLKILECLAAMLKQQGNLNEHYSALIADSIFRVARDYRFIDYQSFVQTAKKAKLISRKYLSRQHLLYRVAVRTGGLDFAELLIRLRQFVFRHLRSSLKKV